MVQEPNKPQPLRFGGNGQAVHTMQTQRMNVEEIDDVVDDSQSRYGRPLQRRIGRAPMVDSTITEGLPIVARQRASLNQPPVAKTKQTKEKLSVSKRKPHWMLYAGLGMLAAMLLWSAFNWVGVQWQKHQDDVNFGFPRTYQTDAVVGHNDSASSPSHFILQNINGQIVVIEYPGGDPTKAMIVVGPKIYAPDANYLTLTAAFVTIDGKVDMTITLEGQQQPAFMLMNDGSKFNPPGKK